MKHNKTFITAAVTLAAAALSAEAFAAGFQLNEQSITGLGKAYAGEGITGDDLSAAWYNPAGMTLLPGTQAQAGIVGVEIDLSYKGDSGATENGRKRTAPIIHQMITHQFTDRLWGGFAIAMPYGLSVSYNQDWEGASRGTSGRVFDLTFNPSLAYKVSDTLSVGAGWQAQYVKPSLTLKKSMHGMGVLSRIEAKDWGYGWNAGIMWSPTENLRFGFGYRSQMNHHARGHLILKPDSNTKKTIAQYQAAAAAGNAAAAAALAMIKSTIDSMGIDASSLMANGSVALAGGANMKSPANANLTVTWKYSPKLRISGTIRWTDWSSFGTLRITGYTAKGELPHDQTDVRMNWRDTWFASVGYDLDITPLWTIRGGVAFDRSPVRHAVDRTSLVPDANRIWATLGATWKPTKNLQIDLAATHLHGIGNSDLYDDAGKKIGHYDKLNCWMYGAGVVYRF